MDEDFFAEIDAINEKYKQEKQKKQEIEKYSVSEFLDLVNGTLEYAYTGVVVEGEVDSFKVNQGKWVFFDLKDKDGATVSCFLPVFQLRVPLEDGMKIMVKALPKVTRWGRFSLTVKQIMPVGEGSIKKGFELLKLKLEKEGLFDPARKRKIPENLVKIGVISSTQAAGYADFCKIINSRWGGLEIQIAHTQVQGMNAADQMISALRYFNEQAEVQIIAIIRGGGSADDLAVFNDEALAREVAGSRIPVITGIGHEVDESLVDLVADIRASTPSNVAEMLTADKGAEKIKVVRNIREIGNRITQEIEHLQGELNSKLNRIQDEAEHKIDTAIEQVRAKEKLLNGLNPDRVLKQGYALVSGDIIEGNVVKITTFEALAEAEIIKVKERKE